jgi:ubiquitin carboxyl-terminal hydrolase 47
MKEGQFVYELFSILIHSGGAHAGHYYAYIKDSANNQWYKFNDVMVYRISFLEIISTFGQNISKKKRYSNNVQDRSNAYMLMYRQIDPDFNVNEVPKSLISQELRDEVENDVTVEKIKLLERERKDNRMQLKVIYDDESKAFWVNRKEDPLTFLLLQAMKEFEIDNLEVSDCRLRAYNIVNKVMQETYTGKENQTFEELSIFPLKTLALETKKPEESFEELDPNQITLKVNKWIRGLTILDEDNLKPLRIKISKEETMEQLIEKLSNISEIPVENLRVFKRRAIGQGKNVEELSLPKNMNRKLKIIRINDGLNLFIENGSYDHPDVDKYNFLSKEMVKNKWETEFELDRNRFVIQFNIPVEDAQTDDQVKDKPDTKIDYCLKVIMDKRMTVLDLKAEISKQLGIGLDELIFKRNIHGTEIKEDDLTLKQASLYNMICLYIKKGIPSHENEKRLKFILSEYMTEKDKQELDLPTADSLYYTMRDLIEIPVNTHQTTLKVKHFVCEKIKESCQIDLDPTRIRLREKANDRLTKYYRNDTILEQYAMFEGKPIAIQVLSEPEELDLDSILIMIRCWNPSTWELSPMKEIVVKRYSTLDNFSHVIQSEYPSIGLEDIECCKIMSTFFRVQLPYEKWYGLANKEDFMASNPFYLSTDGLLMIVKDNSLKERELTDEERKEFGCAEYESAIFTTTAKGKRGYGVKEKSIKINVKKKIQKSAFDDALVLMPEDKKQDGQTDDLKDVVMKTEESAETNDTANISTLNEAVSIAVKELDNDIHENGYIDVDMKVKE